MAYLRDTDFYNEVAMGRVADTSVVNKWGYNSDVDTASPEIVASFGGAFDPITDIITTAQTFTITFNSSTDGLGTNGAGSLFFTYIDSSNNEATAVHVLSNTGSEVTAFTGFGINRVVVLSSGSDGFNANDITITATTDTTTQALIPAEASVTQQCLYHVPIGYTFQIKKIKLNALKLGGGSAPKITFKLYSWSRVTSTRYDIFTDNIDTDVENNIPIDFDDTPLIVTGREVIYLEADTDTANTSVSGRFTGIQSITT